MSPARAARVMTDFHVPIVKDLVLIGGGHSHVAVLKRFGMEPLPGVRVTLITRDVHTPYSGMLPGLVAGHYEFDEAHIDLEPLARFAKARLYHDEAIRLDLQARRVVCRRRPPVSYDIVSINVGSTPSLSVPDAAQHAVPVKPISNFVDRWLRLRERVRAASGTVRIGIIGGGAAGVELTLAAQFALTRMRADAGRSTTVLEFHLFSATESVLPTHNHRVRHKFDRVLRERGIHVHRGQPITNVEAGRVRAADGSTVDLDEIVWATEAAAQPWLRASGLAVDAAGFVRVGDTLESVSHHGVFAAGDVAAVVSHPREKAGVFAVRQGPPLADNLRRALTGQPLRPFRPQRRFLSLISTGDKYAIASRGQWALEGRYIWVWKDWIDRRFMDRYTVLPAMPTRNGVPATGLAPQDTLKELSTVAMRCGGCGAKIGSTVLERVLARLKPVSRGDVLAGLEAPDDAAIECVPAGKVVLRTVDAFRAIVDDPFLFGKITANHCLSDIYAMGGEPQSALAIASVPYGLETKVEDTLEQLLAGAVEVLNDAGTALVGGHSTESAELSLGLAISGLADPHGIWRKGGMRAGDYLVLTKPIGTGTLFAADMRLKAKGRWIAGALEMMLQSNRAAAACLRRHGATACTDVTGFGVLGHLSEMTRASACDARLFLRAVPLLDGARETVSEGIVSSLQPENLRLRRAIRNVEDASGDPTYPLIFDPQTAGGLLASVPAATVERCIAELRASGYERAAVIGRVEAASGQDGPIRIEF